MKLPMIGFAGKKVSRLILGGNPVSAHSHQDDERDAEMADYFTTAKAKALLRSCEAQGITAMQMRGDSHILRLYREYRNEGGAMDFIAQTASEVVHAAANIRRIAAAGAIAIYHHGTETGRLWEEGRRDIVRERLDAIRQTGLWVGLGSHSPEIIEYAEEKGWDVDFYMASMYDLYKTNRRRQSLLVSGERETEIFDDADRARMCAVIRSVPKPCLAFKILAAGRKPAQDGGLRESFHYVLGHIKPTDAVVVGMFPKYRDQVAENAALVREFGAPS